MTAQRGKHRRIMKNTPINTHSLSVLVACISSYFRPSNCARTCSGFSRSLSYPIFFDSLSSHLLEDSVHDLATNGCTGAKDGSVTKLLTELLAALLELARLLVVGLGAVGHVERCVTVV